MAYDMNDMKRFRESELKSDDTFRFECSMCGSCCRSRQEPIIVTGADVFRIARALGTSLPETVTKNTHMTIGSQSHAPVLTLAERMDGSCRLLRKGKCMVHRDKPAVCALFPLGRYYDSSDDSYHYFWDGRSCKNNIKPGKEWTLREWLDEFKIEESLDMTAAWHKLMIGIVDVTNQMKDSEIRGEFLGELMLVMYLNYDIKKPYIPQVEENMELAKAVFQRRFHKELKF